MNRYEITYINFDVDRTEFPYGRTDVIGIFEAKNGIEAIYTALRSRGVEEYDLAEARTIGSNKRLTLAGITFEARKEG